MREKTCRSACFLATVFHPESAINITLVTERPSLCFLRLACKVIRIKKAQPENVLADSETPKGPTVADLFRRAQAIRHEDAQTSYRDIAKQLVRENAGAAKVWVPEDVFHALERAFRLQPRERLPQL